MKKIFSLALASLCLVSCTSKKAEQDTVAPKTLVVYYSQEGTTKAVAEEIAKQLSADIVALEVESPYDGDYGTTIARCQQEMASGVVPVAKPLGVNVADYDRVFLGYPVWFGTFARPIMGLLKNEQFEGKKVVSFCTFGSGGLQQTTRDLQAALPKAEVIEGYGVRAARKHAIETEVTRFLVEGGYVKGEVEILPEYCQQQPVSDLDVEVFNAACGSYQFPLGTPVTVGKRETQSSTDYDFRVENQGPDGKTATTTIYVTVAKEEGATPEFTMVVR